MFSINYTNFILSLFLSINLYYLSNGKTITYNQNKFNDKIYSKEYPNHSLYHFNNNTSNKLYSSSVNNNEYLYNENEYESTDYIEIKRYQKKYYENELFKEKKPLNSRKKKPSFNNKLNKKRDKKKTNIIYNSKLLNKREKNGMSYYV